MNKQALTEALMAFENLKGKGVVLSGRYIIEDAARLVERLLPGECEMCEGVGKFGHFDIVNCRVCHGSGQVWDEGIVEAVAKANFVYFNNDKGYGAETWKRLPSAVSAPYLEQGRAVLSALVGLLTEKVE